MNILRTAFGLSVALSANLASAQQAEVVDILGQMVGCFRVTYTFVEDGEHDAFFEPVLEKAELTSQDPLTITRSLILGQYVQPHWSEVWTQLEDRRWRQHVVGPFRDFRYECDGEWLHNQWSCTAPHAAKPRRDQDRPYEYLDRVNTLQVNGKRWVHAQNNQKFMTNGELYSIETAWNVYEKVEDSLCEVQR